MSTTVNYSDGEKVYASGKMPKASRRKSASPVLKEACGVLYYSTIPLTALTKRDTGTNQTESNIVKEDNYL